MTTARKAAIHKLLKGLETGDPDAVSVIHPEQYIQHNPQTQTGREGLAALFARLAKTNPRVNLVRTFSDGDFVFAHTEYDFSTRRIGFEVFRFEGDVTVEHWDNIQPRRGPNPAGRTMVDGPTEAADLDATESNRTRVRSFVEAALVGNDDAAFEAVDEALVQHDPVLSGGRAAFLGALERHGGRLGYDHLHRVLAEGNFVLAVSEGTEHGAHAALYDLFRVDAGRIVEHWNTVEHVAPEAEWKHGNGKF